MNLQNKTLTPEQKSDAAEIAAILKGAPMNADLLCRMTAAAYIAGMKAGAILRRDGQQISVTGSGA